MVLSKQVLIIQHKFPIRNKDESLSYQNSDEVNINRYHGQPGLSQTSHPCLCCRM